MIIISPRPAVVVSAGANARRLLDQVGLPRSSPELSSALEPPRMMMAASARRWP